MVIANAFEKHLREVNAWIDGKPYVKALRVSYHEALSNPIDVSQRLAEFLEFPLDIEKMLQQVDGSLYRNRVK